MARHAPLPSSSSPFAGEGWGCSGGMVKHKAAAVKAASL